MPKKRGHLPYVTAARALYPYVVEVTFDDGTRRRIDLKDEIWGEVFEPLKDPNYFMTEMVVTDWTIEWPSGANIAPETLYEMGELLEEPAMETNSKREA